MAEQVSNAPENNSLQVLLINLDLKREGKEDYMQVRESKVGTGLQIGSNSFRFLLFIIP